MDTDIQQVLALACCRGPKQEKLAHELLAGSVQIRSHYYGYSSTPVVGNARVAWTSYRGLKTRLIEAGFVFSVDNQAGKITMKYKEKAQTWHSSVC